MRVNKIIKAENIWQQQIDKKSLSDGEKAQSYSTNSNTIVQVNEIEKQTTQNHKEKTDQRNKKPTPKPHLTVKKEKKEKKEEKHRSHGQQLLVFYQNEHRLGYPSGFSNSIYIVPSYALGL